jgi:hypothetical protein
MALPCLGRDHRLLYVVTGAAEFVDTGSESEASILVECIQRRERLAREEVIQNNLGLSRVAVAHLAPPFA